MFITAFFIISKKMETTQKGVYTYYVILFSFKKCYILQVVTWMNLENILDEINQMQKDKYCKIYELLRVVKFIDRKQNGGYQGLGEEGKGRVIV